MSQYAVAIRRERREQAPDDWKDQLAKVDGVAVVGDTTGRTVLIEASAEARARVRERLGDDCHIEPVIRHQPREDPTGPASSRR